ncbi:MAG: 2TM domain-containing protein [Thermomicrobiales bacterium]
MQSTWTPPPRSQNPWQLGPSAARMARWVFGLGFFSVHLGIYLIGGLTLLMINLYRSPDDLWVGGPLIRWGVIVVIHFLGAVITWAVTTAFDAAEANRRQVPPMPRNIPVAQRAGAFAPQPSVAQPPAYMMPPVEPAPPRRRFSPARPTPPATIEVAERGVSPRQSTAQAQQHRASPPGWTVVKVISGECQRHRRFGC